MTSCSTASRGLFIPLRERIRRAAIARVAVLALSAYPLAIAEANITTIGNVAPAVGPGDTTVGVNVGVGRNGSGTLTVDGGSVLTITHVGGGIIVGGTNPTSGQGVVNIDGPGSLIETAGQGGFVNNGNFGTASTADLNITNGGVLRTTFLNWPRGDFLGGNAGTATVVVDGVGSAIYLSGNDVAGNAASINNRDGGTGTFTLRNGAAMAISAPAATLSGPGGTLGRDVGGSGTLSIESGATLVVTASSLGGGFTVGRAGTGTINVVGAGSSLLLDGAAPGTGGGFTLGQETTGLGTLNIRDGASVIINRNRANCCMTVGLLGRGTLEITNGGQFTVNDLTAAGTGGISFGGNNSVATGGPFSALISGVGSNLTVNGTDTNIGIGVGNSSLGSVTVANGGTLSVDTISIARGAGSNGTLNVIGTGTNVNLVGDAAGTLGGGFSVGSGGIGAVNVIGGAAINVDASATASRSGVSVGGSPVTGGGGTGTLTVSGAGSRISMIGSTVLLRLGLDISGGAAPTTGIMTVASGGQAIVDPAGKSSVGDTTGSIGSLVVTGVGSLLDAGAFLGIGRDTDDNPGGTGIATASAGGVIKATDIHVGASGTLSGSGGTIVGNVVNMGGTVNPGESPGRLVLVGSYESIGGRLVVEVDANGNHDVLTVVGAASFDSATVIEIKIDPAFQPAVGTSFNVVQVRSTPQGQAQSLLALNVPPGGGGATPVGALSSLVTTVNVEPVPSAPLVVAVDIQPGLAPNVLNAQSKGGLPVAIMGSPAFSVTEIDASSITLSAPTVALAAAADPFLCQVVDVDGDQIADLLCYLVRGGSEIPGDAMAVLGALTTSGIAVRGSDAITVVDRTLMLSGLSPAKVWIGLKNSDAVGLRLDVLTEMHLGPTKVGQGRVDNVPAGGSGFNNALLHTIPLSLVNGPVPFASGTQLKLTVSARRTCFGGGHSSGAPRFWYNGRPVDAGAQRDSGTRFGATIDGDESDYFLRGGLTLSPLPGSSRLFVDKTVDSKQPCSDRKFIPFGTWTIAP